MNLAPARALLTVATLGVLTAATVTACTGGASAEAQALCDRLDSGVVPIAAIAEMGENSGASTEAEGRDVLARAVDAIRGTCPQHENAARSMDALLNLEAFMPEPQDYSDPAPLAPPVAADADEPGEATVYTYEVTSTAGTVSITHGLNGSNGSLDTSGSWSKEYTADPTRGMQTGTLTAVSRSGVTGEVTCRITDQYDNLVDERTATSEGGDYGYASVACGVDAMNPDYGTSSVYGGYQAEPVDGNGETYAEYCARTGQSLDACAAG